MKRIFLHVGLHKTGTTTIQMFCKANRARLRNLRIYFPADQSSQHRISKDLKSGQVDKVNKYFEKLAGHNIEHVLISAESLSKLNDPESASLYKILSSHFDKITLLAYIRNQPDAIQSIYTQMLKNDNITIPIAEFYQTNALKSLNYFRLLKRLSRNYPDAKILVRDFDKAKDNLLLDFSSMINVPYDDQLKLPDKKRNTKPSAAEIVQLLQSKNIETTVHIKEKGYSLLNKREIREIKVKYRRSNRKVARAYFENNKIFQ